MNHNKPLLFSQASAIVCSMGSADMAPAHPLSTTCLLAWNKCQQLPIINQNQRNTGREQSKHPMGSFAEGAKG